ncbi:MAG: hypothetical protein JXA33_22350 [Anaerolineae bacterium]|nr:hypothetical protein [Anaerolineae bacterium]
MPESDSLYADLEIHTLEHQEAGYPVEITLDGGQEFRRGFLAAKGKPIIHDALLRELARMTHDGPVTAVAFSLDGRWVATASGDGTTRVWPWQTQDQLTLDVRFNSIRRQVCYTVKGCLCGKSKIALAEILPKLCWRHNGPG